MKGSESSPGRQSNETFQAVFFARYDELVADIMQTEYQIVRNRVKLWFDFLDGTAIFAAVPVANLIPLGSRSRIGR